MSGSVVGAVPFLGPLIAAWVALTVGVMGLYFVTYVRRSRTVEVDDRGWQSSRVEPRPVPSRSALTSYDMEHYPDQEWGSPADPAWTAMPT